MCFNMQGSCKSQVWGCWEDKRGLHKVKVHIELCEDHKLGPRDLLQSAPLSSRLRGRCLCWYVFKHTHSLRTPSVPAWTCCCPISAWFEGPARHGQLRPWLACDMCELSLGLGTVSDRYWLQLNVSKGAEFGLIAILSRYAHGWHCSRILGPVQCIRGPANYGHMVQGCITIWGMACAYTIIRGRQGMTMSIWWHPGWDTCDLPKRRFLIRDVHMFWLAWRFSTHTSALHGANDSKSLELIWFPWATKMILECSLGLWQG